MKLHRLELAHFRGITHRVIDFPDRGVVVVSGANEIGKSSMIDALDLLLEVKDSSRKKEVKQIQPTDADVGTEITAEISTGPYRFVYFKRFNKSPETRLTVSAPRNEQLTGDRAHERVEAMLNETLDTALWRALRVMQARSTDAVDLSGCDALSRALDVAAGDTAALSGSESPLIERIDKEYGRYFTGTAGRPTGEWARAITQLDAAEAAVQRAATAVEELEERVRRHDELSDQLAETTVAQADADANCTAAQAAAGRVAEITEALRAAELVAATAGTAATTADAAHTERERLRGEVDTKTTGLAELDRAAQAAVTERDGVADTAATAGVAAEQAVGALAAAVARTQVARGVIEHLAARADIDRLAGRLARIDAAEVDRDRLDTELAAIVLTATAFSQIERAATELDVAEAAKQAASAAVTVTAASDLDLAVGGEQISLTAGGRWSTSAPTAFEVPGVLTVRVDPGAAARETAATRAAVQQSLADALAAGGVPDLAEARRTDERRRELVTELDRLTHTLTGICGDDSVEELRGQLKQLHADWPQAAPTVGAEAARAELEAAEIAHRQAEIEEKAQREDAVAAARELADKSSRAATLAEQVTTHRGQLDELVVRLAAQREIAGDVQLGEAAMAAGLALQAARQQVAELSDRLAAAAPETVAAQLAAALAAAETLRSGHEQTARALLDIEAQLEVVGSEGRFSALEAAETERAHVMAEHARIGRSARAANLLRTVMDQHRDDARLRYVEPFRAEIQRLGQPVFGNTFAVDVDTDLTIGSRTLDGRTVPYESLSGGAKEQLGILARLAGAALVADDDGVPVLIDDALGFTDPDRLAKMGAVFDTVGASGQVIVLTCTPGRYDAVPGAHRIDLNDALRQQ